VELALDNLDPDHAVGQALLRQRDADGGETEIAVEQLQFAQTLPKASHIDGRPYVIGQHTVNHFLRQDGVAHNLVGTDGERRGIGGSGARRRGGKGDGWTGPGQKGGQKQYPSLHSLWLSSRRVATG
jgi:hypothetical protein